MKKQLFVLLAILSLGAAAARAQSASSPTQSRPLVKTDAVTYLFPEQVSVPAGKPSQVALHFRIAQGLHINSHTPSDEFLIPTTFSIPDGLGVRLDSAAYPAGTGNHLAQGKLRYQACDQNQCMPPKTITVAIDVIGK